MKKRVNFWDVLAWVVLAGIFIWLILKVAGVINTPALLEFAPYFGVVYLAGWAMKKLDTAVDDVKSLKNFKSATVGEINNIKTNCLVNHKKIK
ncbi:MAG: hypothetical protein AABY32_05415 [Nanoarchaeota archaeon]